MSNDPKRALVVIHAANVADFRRQLDAAIAAAQQTIVLPAAQEGDPDTLLRALLDMAQGVAARRRSVVQSEHDRAA